MPVRSLRSRVFRWPERDVVLAAARAWAADVARHNPRVVRVVLFGSYAQGRAGVGSDLDLLVEIERSDESFVRRLAPASDVVLPVQADVLVLTSAELDDMRAARRRFVRELDGSGVALWQRPQ